MTLIIGVKNVKIISSIFWLTIEIKNNLLEGYKRFLILWRVITWFTLKYFIEIQYYREKKTHFIYTLISYSEDFMIIVKVIHLPLKNQIKDKWEIFEPPTIKSETVSLNVSMNLKVKTKFQIEIFFKWQFSNKCEAKGINCLVLEWIQTRLSLHFKDQKRQRCRRSSVFLFYKFPSIRFFPHPFSNIHLAFLKFPKGNNMDLN